MRQGFRPAVRATVAGVTAVGVAGCVAVTQDEGAHRAALFYTRVLPIYAHYRAVQLLNRTMLLSDAEADLQYENCHARYSEPVKELTFMLRGFYLKQAQLMSTQDDFVPKPYMTWVKKTQDCIPSEFEGTAAREYVKSKLKEELGLEFDEVFASWNDNPLGVASIGQVHKAVLKKTGETVAVKFLVPGIESKFRKDIRILKGFCEFALPQHAPAFEEIEKQFCTEFDYRGEAQNLLMVRNNIRDHYKDKLEMPYPHLNLCSKHILVMEYLDGVNLVSGIKEQFSKLAKSQGKDLETLMDEQKSLMEAGKFKFVSIEQKARETRAMRNNLAWIDFGSNTLRFLYNWSIFRLAFGPAEYAHTQPPLDLGSIMELLCRVHGHQIFTDGVFNGDCHPGNFLLLKDGRIGLIDFGQVKHMTLDDRIKLAKLHLAHARRDKAEVVRIHFDDLGVKTKNRNEDIAYRFSAFMNDRDTPDIMGGMNVAVFSDYCEKEDPIIKLPDDFIMAQRASLLLRGLGKAFGIEISMSQQWKVQAEEFLRKCGSTDPNP